MKANVAFSPSEISKAIREVYASRLCKSVTYELQPNDAGGATIVFRVKEYPPTGLNAGILYNSFSNTAIILN